MPRTTPEDMMRLLASIQGGVPVQSPVMGQEGPRRGMEANVAMLQALREARPVESPAAPGTITQTRRQAEEQARLQREQMAQQAKLQREQMALQERLARMQASAARAGAAGAPAPATGMSKAEITGQIQEMAHTMAAQGYTFSEVLDQLRQPRFVDIWESGVMSLKEAEDLARQYYKPTLQTGQFGTAVTAPPPTVAAHELLPGERPGPLGARLPEVQQRVAAQATQTAQQRALEAALQDLQRHVSPAQIQPGTFLDPVTGLRYITDEWGDRTYEGQPGWDERMRLRLPGTGGKQ